VDEDTVSGSGVMDMKGGLLIMQEALRRFLPGLPEDGRIVCVLNGDEEIGAGFSSSLISSCAKDAFACLCYEPMRESGALVRSRKGVISFTVRCTGIGGHAGAAYLTSASAIQQLCAVASSLYTMRDDARNVSINIGVISGGTASNVVCDEASLEGEVRYYDPALTETLLSRLNDLCAAEGVPGTNTELTVHAAHPPFEANEKSGNLLALAQKIGAEMGMELPAEDTGGAGDVAYASIAGAAALDGLGLHGRGMHTLQETGTVSSFMRNVKLSAALMEAVFKHPELL
jgi:glutamate carboxypeptidase